MPHTVCVYYQDIMQLRMVFKICAYIDLSLQQRIYVGPKFDTCCTKGCAVKFVLIIFNKPRRSYDKSPPSEKSLSIPNSNPSSYNCIDDLPATCRITSLMDPQWHCHKDISFFSNQRLRLRPIYEWQTF